MGVLLAYLLKVSLVLALFYIFNKLLLSKECFYRLNRAGWLFIIFFAHALPLLGTLFQGEEMVETSISSVVTPEYIRTIVSSVNGPNVMMNIIILLYFAGVLAILMYKIYTYYRLFRLILPRRADLYSLGVNDKIQMLEDAKKKAGYDGRIRFIVHEEKLSPFSWFNFIVVSRADLGEDGESILLHEISHIKNKDSLDIIIADLVTCLHWFNPASWLIKKEIEQIHEYQADDSVLQAGIDARTYQYLLIKKAIGQRYYTMTNSFNHSNIKKRITMMLKIKSNNPGDRNRNLLRFATKCLYIIPLTFVTYISYSNDKVDSVLEQISDTKVINFSKNKADTIVVKEVPRISPLYIVNEKPVSSKYVSSIPKEIIKSIDVIKGGSDEIKKYISKYGDAAKDGVISFTLVKDVADSLLRNSEENAGFSASFNYQTTKDNNNVADSLLRNSGKDAGFSASFNYQTTKNDNLVKIVVLNKKKNATIIVNNKEYKGKLKNIGRYIKKSISKDTETVKIMAEENVSTDIISEIKAGLKSAGILKMNTYSISQTSSESK